MAAPPAPADDSATEQDIFERDIILEEIKRTLLFATTDPVQFKTRSTDLNAQQRKFGKLQSKIEKALMKAKLFNKDEQLKIRNDFNDCYYAILLHVNKFKEADQEGRRMSRSTIQPMPQNQVLHKLPTLPLPSFSGEATDWPSYFDLYQALIHNNNAYSPAEKFRYLLLTLKNEPHNLIKSIPITDENYAVALEILKNRYENRRMIASKHLDRILDCEACTSESNASLRKLVNVYMENIKALETMRFPVNAWSFILLNVLLRKIPNSVRKRFELSLSKISDVPTVDVLIRFLEQEISTFEIMSGNETKKGDNASSRYHANSVGQNRSSTPSGSGPRRSFAVTESSNGKNDKQCILCDAQHVLYKCPKFLNMTPNDRYNFVKTKNVCFNCLNVGHDLRSCKSQYTCQSCKMKHHSLLHFEKQLNPPMHSNQAISFPPTEDTDRAVAFAPIVQPEQQNQTTSHLISASCDSSAQCSTKKCIIMLSTALVNVQYGSAKHLVRCLVDSGSQASFMTETCARRIGLSYKQVNSPIYGIGEGKPIYPKGMTTCVISPRKQNLPAISVEALILPKLVSCLPKIPVPTDAWPHINNLYLADPDFNAPSAQPIEMLLGADILPYILLGNIVRGHPDAPIAMNSVFGYLLMGKVSFDVGTPPPLQVCHSSFFEDSDLQRFWELEAIPEEKTLTADERLSEAIFERTHTRDDTGRYVVALPFKDAPILGQSRDIAVSRFRKLEFRLERNHTLKKDYHACLQEYVDHNQMELCDPPSKEEISHYYIPHHCVVKEASETTKVRVVFDAGCKTTNGSSLNDQLLTGPKLHSDIVDILLKFRIHKIVFTADIKAMYRNIAVRDSDWDYQRIVWRSEPSAPIRDYRIRVVVFGVNSSPYVALRVIRQLARDEADKFPLASATLMDSVFVDDIITGEASEAKALVLQEQLIGICASAGFELRKWHSNSQAILAAAASPHGERPDNVSFATVDNDTSVKVLGLQWNPNADGFSFVVHTSNSSCTKRSILSEIAKIYDPLGLLSPVILYAKHLMQLLWIAGIGWDESPPIDIVNAWSNFTNELPLLSECFFPRHIFDQADIIDLHGFADASERAYAGCVYVRCKCSDNKIRVFLVLAKMRVSPLNRLSIPRLELMACQLLSKLISKVMLAYSDRITFDHVYTWSDSTVALAWLRSPPHEWKTFVSNRTSDILSRVPASCWRHVPSYDNPADSASRGILPSAFLKHSLWFHGPCWLTEEAHTWPSFNPNPVTQEEKRNLPLLANPSSVSTDTDELDVFSKFSTLGKLVRVVSYIFRFYHKCKKMQVSFPAHITVPEYTSSLNKIIGRMQHSVFAEDIKNISQGNLPTNRLKRLSPFLDKDNLLRVGGRLHKSQLSFESKHQLILPAKHYLTTLIIDNAHVIHLHTGPQTTQYLLLQRYWILAARNAIRQRIHKCISCFRTRPIPTQPRMAPMPSPRLNSNSRIFLRTAVDYCGPFMVRANNIRNAKIIKSYVAVFVCMSVKAVHLELVSDLTTESFLAALRRFTSRRGMCTDIYSDNGKNFVGCNNKLQELFAFLNSDPFQRALHEKTLSQGLTFHFQPVTGSHFNGLVEAGVKSFKHHLYRVIGTRTQTYDEMHTLLCQVEAVLNSRPLCVLSSDATDPLPLTPAHFLIGGPLAALPDVSFTDLNPNRLTRWQWVQQCTQHFWKRWSNEYLHELQQANKWFHNRGAPIREGMIVVVRDDNLPPLQWKLARVHAIHPGTDNVTRVVTLQMGNSFTKRPVVKICPLPIE